MSDPRLLRRAALVGVGAVAATLAVSSAAGGALAGSGPLQGALAALLVLCVLALVRRRPPGPGGERIPREERREPEAPSRDPDLLAGISRAETVAAVTVDRGGVVVEWNRGAEGLFGIRRELAVGARLRDAVPAGSGSADERAEVEQVLRTGRALAARRRRLELPMRGAVEVMAFVLPVTSGGGVSGATLLYAELGTREADEDRRARLADSAPAGLFSVEPDGRVAAVSRGLPALTGRSRESLEGSDVVAADFLPPHLRERLRGLAAGDGRGALEEDFDAVLPDGSSRPLVLVAAGEPGGGASALVLSGASRRRLAAERDAARAALEAAREGPGAGVPGDRPAPGRSAGRPTRVLVVDDSDDNRELFAHMLRSRGADVTTARSAREALAAVAGGGIDLVLLDLRLPEIDGFELARRIRTLPAGAGLPLVAVTALTSEAERERCRAEGLDDFVGKPVGLATMTNLLARWGRGAAPKG